MKTVARFLLVAGLLSACAPAPLRPQSSALLRVDAWPATPALSTVTGEQMYPLPGPGALLVRTDHDAFVTTLLLPPSGEVTVLPVGQVSANETRTVPLPAALAALGYTQVFTVASLQPMNLQAAQGLRSLKDAAAVVEAQARTLPKGAYNVANTNYRITRFGTLRVTSAPPRAEVRIADRQVGRTPLTIPDVPEGDLDLTVSAPGFRPYHQRVLVTPETTTEVQAYLQFVTGTLNVQSNVPAQVTIDRRRVGNTPLSVPVRPGTVTVNVTPQNPALHSETLLVRVQPNAATSINCAATGTTFICTAP